MKHRIKRSKIRNMHNFLPVLLPHEFMRFEGNKEIQ